MRLRSVRVRNYKALRDIEMRDIPGFAVLVGANGSGKTTFIDVFNFLRDCLRENVRDALRKRGGFGQVISRGYENQSIFVELKIELDFATGAKKRIVTYSLEIGEENKRPLVLREILSWKRGSHGQPFRFIDFKKGEGEAIAESFDAFDSDVAEVNLKREYQALDSPDILALKGLGQFKRFDAASQLRELIEGWTVNDLHIEDARGEPDAAPAEHLSPSGDNIALYAQFLKEYHSEIYGGLVRRMAERVPGIAEVSAEDTGDGRVALRFRDDAFERSFIARAVSDGTIKMFAYLALLSDPHPHPLLCVEEPENQLYPSLLEVLAEEFGVYADRRKGLGQVFVTTHSPDFLNAVPLESIFWLEKISGYSTLHRAKNDEILRNYTDEGELPGWLWRQNLFTGANP